MTDFAVDRNEKFYETIITLCSSTNLTKYCVVKNPRFEANHFEATCVAEIMGYEEQETLKPLYKWCEEYELMIGGQGLIEVKEYKGDIAK